MEDLRSTIINNVMIRLTGRLNPRQMEEVKTALCLELHNIEATKRCTELVEVDDRPLRLLTQFIATKRLEGRSEKTLLQYQLHLGKMLVCLDKDLNKVTAYDIRYYLSDYKQKRKVSNLTLDNMRRCISSFFHWLSDEGFIRRNIAAAVKKITYKKTVKKPYSQKELEKLRWGCANLRDLALVEFLYSTGCRVSEVVNLDITDIDFMSKSAVVLGKGNKQRTVYLTESACLHLNDYLNSRDDRNPALFVSLRKPCSRFGKNGIEAMLRRLGKATGIKKVHPHRYRRTLATYMMDRGANIQDVAKILGHEDIRTTEIYCFASDTNTRNTYYKFAC